MDEDYAPVLEDERLRAKDPLAGAYPPVVPAAPGGMPPALPAAPNLGGPPPVGDPNGEPPALGIQPGVVNAPRRPQPGDYAPKPMGKGKKALGILFSTMAGMNPHDTAAAGRTAHDIFQGPAERGQQQYEAAAGAYDTEKTQGINERKEAADERHKAAADTQYDKVPVVLPNGATIMMPSKDVEKYQAAHEGNQTKKDINADTNASREGMSADKNQTTLDVADKNNASREGIAADRNSSVERVAAIKDKTTRELGMARIAVAKAKALMGPKAPPEVAKAHATLEGSVSRMNIMLQNADDVKKGNQQAGLSLVANHIGMTMGLVPGARINKQIYQEAEASAPWLQRLEAHFDSDGFLSGVVVTPKQADQMVELAVNRLAEDRRAFADVENYYGFHGQGGEAQNPNAPNKAPQATHTTAAGAVNSPKTAEDYLKKFAKPKAP